MYRIVKFLEKLKFNYEINCYGNPVIYTDKNKMIFSIIDGLYRIDINDDCFLFKKIADLKKFIKEN